MATFGLDYNLSDHKVADLFIKTILGVNQADVM